MALLPVSCIGQHGPYLPVETDALIVYEFAKKYSLQFQKHFFWSFAYSSIQYLPTQTNIGYCGTVSINEDAFSHYISGIPVNFRAAKGVIGKSLLNKTQNLRSDTERLFRSTHLLKYLLIHSV